MSGDRQLVREAIAAYFGGDRVTTDKGICYQGGPLLASHLSSFYPYSAKGVPDQYFFTGQPAGAGWGAVAGITSVRRKTTRMAMGGVTSGWRQRDYRIDIVIEARSQLPHIETAEAGLDDLIDDLEALIFADRTLGTTSSLYPTGRLITQAGEGDSGIEDVTDPLDPMDDARGRYEGVARVSFTATTMVAA